ncbi:MAG: hypothetical protein ABSD75_20050 [Terriglobales bacterium]|jgi:hypothetical protein
MRRSLYVATLSLVLLAFPAWAQRHGGGGGGAHFAAHGGSVGHSSGAFRGGSFAHSAGVRIRSGNSYNYRGLYRQRGHYPYLGYYPYGYYAWYADPLYDAEDDDAYADGEYNPGPYRDDGGVQRDLDHLNGKIDRLQQDVEARNRKPDTEPETTLVFRDQHVEEVRNYAIAGGTLWVLNEQAAKKIPLAQLDLEATVKKNDERGIDFQVPR